MVLAETGAGLLDQGTLETDNHNHSVIETGWATAPDGLQWTLDNCKPTACANDFALFALNTKDAISRKIVWTIHHYRIAPVALVHGWNHWIVVRGYEASAAPANPDDTSYCITSFDVNDPAPALTCTPPPPPHLVGDGCGTGGTRGIADQHVAYSTWQSDYMTGVPAKHWNGKFVAVCDSDPSPVRIGKQSPAPKRMSGDRILTPDEAAACALAGLEQYGLREREPWKRSLAKTTPGTPILVQRLDRLDSFYYIVPMQVSRKVVPVLVCVDGRFGNYLQAGRIPDRGGNALHDLNFDPKVALELIRGHSINLGRKGRLTVRKEAFALYPTLVWRPCRESLSPYVPFFMISVGSTRIYLRVDGQVVTRLHIHDRGI
jgi:hypothetical protein